MATPPAQSADDNREFERHDLSRLTLAVLLGEDGEIDEVRYVRTSDLCEAGVGVRTGEPLGVGGRLVLRFDREDREPLVVFGVVRHSIAEPGGWHRAGVQFVRAPAGLDLWAIVSRAA